MSGGHFDYNQYRINDIADSIERELNKQGKEIPKENLYMDKEYYEKYPNEKFYTRYSKEVNDKMKEGVKALKLASIYAQRIDWLLSRDDREDSFLKRLKEDINKLKNE
jgi:hypothetical protein